MKTIVLAGRSLDHVIQALHEGYLDYSRCQRRSFPPGSCACSMRDVDQVKLSLLGSYLPRDEPLELYVTSRAELRGSHATKPLIRCRLMPERLPRDAFVKVRDHVLVPSPEQYFVRRCADIRDVPECLALGMELAGQYSREWPGENGERCVYHCLPLTSRMSIASYLARAEGVRGRGAAARALPWLLDNSFSPMETLLVTLLTLPLRHRGANLPMPQLNPKLSVPENKRHLTQRAYYQPDIYWEQFNLDVEYDSKERHATKAEYKRDMDRKSDIEALGIRVIPVRPKDLYSTEAFERKLAQIVEHIGKVGTANDRRRLRKLAPDTAHDALHDLRRELLPSQEERLELFDDLAPSGGNPATWFD